MSRLPLPDPQQPTDDETTRAFRLAPTFAKAISSVSKAIYGEIHLSPREREAVRMRIAQINACQLCLARRFDGLDTHGVNDDFYRRVAHWQTDDTLTAREKLAIDYAERFLTQHLSIDDAFFAALNKQFSPEEVFELTAIIAGLMANGRLMQVLQLDQTCVLPPR